MWSSAFGTDYRVRNLNCLDFEDKEKKYMEQWGDSDPNVSLSYGLCLLIKAEATDNQQDTANGIRVMHDLKDEPNSAVPARFFLAEYHLSGGSFYKAADYNLDLAAHYYSHTLALIKAYNPYPPPIYIRWEKAYNIEMTSYFKLPVVYLKMFDFGVVGDYRLRLLNSPSYKGDRNLKTYPDYRENIMEYISLAIKHAGNCSKLPLKRHFNKAFSPYFINLCGMYEEKAKLLKDIQRRRNLILSQDKCQDIGSDEVRQTHCPEIDELDKEFTDAFNSIDEESDRIIASVYDVLISSYY